MNERIRELFKQAGGKTSARNLASNPVQVVETHELWDDRIEKFAELIVAECVSVPYSMWDRAELNADVAVKIDRRIKDHFGIEDEQ